MSQAVSFVLPSSTSSASVRLPVSALSRTQPSANVAGHASVFSAPGATSFCLSTAAGMVGAVVAKQKHMKQKGRSSRSCRGAALDASKALGAMAPCGYWDPCGLMKERVGVDGWQWKDEKTFEKYRVAELKHGRVAMLAATGLLVNVVWKFEGFDLVPQGMAALETEKGGAGFGLLVILAAYFELSNWKGDFTDPLNLTSSMDENMEELRKKELNNGRVGMVATITLLMYDVFEHKLPSEMVYHTTLSPATLPAVFTFLLIVLPLSSGIWNYDTTPAEIKAKQEGKTDKAAELPVAVPVTIKAELPGTEAKAEEAPEEALKVKEEGKTEKDAESPEAVKMAAEEA